MKEKAYKSCRKFNFKLEYRDLQWICTKVDDQCKLGSTEHLLKV